MPINHKQIPSKLGRVPGMFAVRVAPRFPDGPTAFGTFRDGVSERPIKGDHLLQLVAANGARIEAAWQVYPCGQVVPGGVALGDVVERVPTALPWKGPLPYHERGCTRPEERPVTDEEATALRALAEVVEDDGRSAGDRLDATKGIVEVLGRAGLVPDHVAANELDAASNPVELLLSALDPEASEEDAGEEVDGQGEHPPFRALSAALSALMASERELELEVEEGARERLMAERDEKRAQELSKDEARQAEGRALASEIRKAEVARKAEEAALEQRLAEHDAARKKLWESFREKGAEEDEIEAHVDKQLRETFPDLYETKPQEPEPSFESPFDEMPYADLREEAKALKEAGVAAADEFHKMNTQQLRDLLKEHAG